MIMCPRMLSVCVATLMCFGQGCKSNTEVSDYADASREANRIARAAERFRASNNLDPESWADLRLDPVRDNVQTTKWELLPADSQVFARMRCSVKVGEREVIIEVRRADFEVLWTDVAP